MTVDSKGRGRSIFQYFLYGSLAFLVYYLVRNDLLHLPPILSPIRALLAMFFLMLGFLMSALVWKRLLALCAFEVSLAQSVASIGLSVFGKYIPGKIWVVVGRAAYLSEKLLGPLVPISAISLAEQLISLWTGLGLGVFGLLLLGRLSGFSWGLLPVWLALFLIACDPRAHRVLEAIGRKLLRRDVDLPHLSLTLVLSTLPYFLALWLSWSAGLYFLATSLVPAEIPFAAGLAFPFAACVGIVVLIAPGGLGIREGLVAGYLVMAGLDLAQAKTIAVTSRLWFLVGEALFFLSALLVDRLSRPPRKP
ncbi:MAG: hypothetical protein CME06_11185 [Gemmatimonadetes bacterium]|nr:hypothetical protein [Gemmatimonadota bacterium]